MGSRHTPRTGSPDPRDKPPANALGVVAIARQFGLQHAVLGNRAVQQEWQAEGSEERRSEPGVECQSARDHDDDSGEISWMADDGVRTAADDQLAAVGLDADD